MKSESAGPKPEAITSTLDSSEPEPNRPETLADWALKYAADGFEVFPVNPDTKAPIGSTEGPNGEPVWMATKGHTSATTDAAIIASWWQLRPDALIGCRIPKDMVVLDIDPRHDGLDTWGAIVAGHDLPTTRLHKSGRNDGGFHIWWQHPGLDRIDPGAGIDVLHHGHRYSILPPSPHPATGSPYFWVQSPEDSDVAGMPAWLIDAVTPPPPAPAAQAATKAPTIASNNALYGDGPTPAEWYNEPWSEILTGWQLVAGNGDDDGSKWAHPTATAAFSATIRHGCLFVYSPTPGLPVTETNDPNGLTKFRAEALLHYRGDMAACAKDIRQLMPDRVTGELPSTTQPLIVPDAEHVEQANDTTPAIISGFDFLFRERPNTKPVWGQTDGGEILWAGGEPLIIAGGIGAGKTTVLLQLLRGRLGLDTGLLGWPIRPGERNTLYLASDRPNQIAKAMRRTTSSADDLDRLWVIEGPPMFSIVENPGGLRDLARQADADTIMVDSLKDIAGNLSDEAVGSAINQAHQLCVADGIEVVANHHARKASGENKKPNKLDDLYGSTWITAGAGSVLFLFGQPGADEVELIHLKQPEAKIEAASGANLTLVHDHEAGRSKVIGQFDPLQFLYIKGDKGATAKAAAKAETKQLDPTEAKVKTGRRKLDNLVNKGLAEKGEGSPVSPDGGRGSTAASYYLTNKGRKAYEQQQSASIK